MDCHYFWQALRKKQLVADGKLGKFGKVLESTPVGVKQELATLCNTAGGKETSMAAIPPAAMIRREWTDATAAGIDKIITSEGVVITDENALITAEGVVFTGEGVNVSTDEDDGKKKKKKHKEHSSEVKRRYLFS